MLFARCRKENDFEVEKIADRLEGVEAVVGLQGEKPTIALTIYIDDYFLEVSIEELIQHLEQVFVGTRSNKLVKGK